jgi:hypothetical protein
MDAKTKAAYLVVKYMSKVVSKRVAIECALVCCDEFMDEYPGPCPEGSYEMERHLFWADVKSEIEKI